MLARRLLLSSARISQQAAVTRAISTSSLRCAPPASEGSASMWAPKDGSSDTKHEMFQPQDPSNKPSLADDPWAIPLQNPQADPDPNEIPLAHYRGGDTAHPEGRNPNEDTETMRARLVYQSRKRGTLEMEMLASTFIDAGKLKSMSREDMLEYDRLLTLPDWTIYYWAIGKKEPPAESGWRESKVLAELKKHAANEGKELRKMPEISSYGIKSAAQE